MLDPASAAGPGGAKRVFRTSVSMFLNLSIVADQKLLKSQTSQLTSQKLKNMTPARPKLDLVVMCGLLWPLTFDMLISMHIWINLYSI